MHPVHDVDVLLLLAMALCSKKRRAELFEVMAAADLIHGSVPPEAKLSDAFHRLSTHGLICEAQGRYTLTPAAQEVMSGQPRKADTAERILVLKEKLSTILAHRTSGKGAGQNMGMPRPKPADSNRKRPGQWRKPGAAGRRKV